jgi:hypothetical protein
MQGIIFLYFVFKSNGWPETIDHPFFTPSSEELFAPVGEKLEDES